MVYKEYGRMWIETIDSNKNYLTAAYDERRYIL